MPRQSATVVENNFVGGLITETTALKFPPNACTETFNCVFDETGRVTRRLGIDFETGPGNTTLVQDPADVYTEFAWIAVGGNGNINYLVQQQANNIFFFDVSDNMTPSANRKSFQIDLDTYIIPGSSRLPMTEQCQYTIHTGNLLIVNPACDPIVIEYDEVSDTITVTAIDIKIRDFAGVEDGLELTERPTESVATLAINNPEHYYNILNQGWYHGSTGTSGPDTGATLAQWDTARTDMPSNADQVALYRSSETDAFDNTVLLNNSPGSTPAPKGHFIFSATEQDRDAAAAAEGFILTLGVIPSFIAPGPYANIGDMTAISDAFDGDTSAVGPGIPAPDYAYKNGGTTAYLGKNYSLSSKRIERAIAYGTNTQGFATLFATDGSSGSNYTGNVTIDLYAKTGAAPANATDGTLLGTVAFNDANDESGGRTIASSDQTTFFTYAWIVVRRTDGVAHTFCVVEVEFYTPGSAGSPIPSTTERPHTIATFAGRIFYAGINGLGLNSSIFFTRIVEKTSEYEQCHQRNDPTSEDFSDLLPDDGGVIRIPEIGNVVKLFSYQTSLIILATNGVWLIGGNNGFAANDYRVRKLSSLGTDAALSVVDFKGVPVWWSEEGINTIQYEANYDSYSVVSLTDQTIKSFLLDIPSLNRRFVKGIFDVQNEAIYWIYNDDVSLTSDRYYIYNSALLMNGLSRAFYPWSINEAGLLPQIRGIFYVQQGDREADPRVKLTTTQLVGLTYSDVSDTNYVDWATTDSTDYESYFISGYRIDGQGQRYIQTPYVFFYFEEEENASAFMQGIWDFYSDSSSGKWSTVQQVYQSNTSNRVVRFRRLKLRGKGRALQIKISSETGKPFTLIGWTLLESGATGV